MKKCLILGNGPSLNDMPLGLLLKYDSFGVNYAKHQPTYFVCVDSAILLDHWQEVYPRAAGAKMRFLSARHKGSSPLYTLPDVSLVTNDRGPFGFAGEKYFTGLTVTYVALKMAFYLGFEEVHLWGVDHSADWKHYRDDYPPGDTDRRAWRMAEQEYHYALAQRVYNDAGRKILNFSHPSKLDSIFERGGKE